MDEELSPYPLFLNAIPLEQLPDDDHAQIECWVRHWARAESERQRRGFEPETLLDRVN